MRGLLSSGTVTSIKWTDPVVVQVPGTWPRLQPTARETYLRSIWEASGTKADVRVVDDAGSLLQVYSPSGAPTRD